MKRIIYLTLGIVVILAGAAYWFINQSKEDAYAPSINPADFVSKVDNKYFTLKPGTKFTYEKKTDKGIEKIEIVVTDGNKKVLGVQTIVIWDRVWLNGQLVEDTRDWYAQDKNGNVWYFGEEVDNYENGLLKDHAGSWEAGINGAKPGIIMKAAPRVGDSYRQEYYKGEAEDMADVVALDKKIKVPYGELNGCLQTRDWSQIDKSANEYKYYCPAVGYVVLEESVIDKFKITKLLEVEKSDK